MEGPSGAHCFAQERERDIVPSMSVRLLRMSSNAAAPPFCSGLLPSPRPLAISLSSPPPTTASTILEGLSEDSFRNLQPDHVRYAFETEDKKTRQRQNVIEFYLMHWHEV